LIDSPHPMSGKTIKDRYFIEDLNRDKLGHGAFGQVYLATDTEYRTDQKVVVKQLQPDYSNCRSIEERKALFQRAKNFFEREARVLEKLGKVSDQIPMLRDYFSDGDEFYIVQEWIDGEPLSKQVLAYSSRLNQQKTIELLIEILEPLAFCHQEGAIHRDLKPDNLMRSHKTKKLFIIDFGAVREVGQLTLLLNGEERPGSAIGTIGYQSPEQTIGKPVLASDVYTVGAIGMQAMTGLFPHLIDPDREAGDVPKWHLTPDCYYTKEFAAVLNRMLAYLPRDRYPDAGAALEALRSLPYQTPAAYVPPTLVAPVVPKAVPAPTTQRRFKGKLSQAEFSFESAQLEKVQVKKTEVVKKPGWLGLWEKEERRVITVSEWKLRMKAGSAEYFAENLDNDVELQMVYVPGGSFTMGSPVGEGNDSERPQRVVMVPGFYAGRYPVTQGQYLAVMGKNLSHWQDAKLPVEQVSWEDAQDFCERLSDRTSKKYRLPSEAEWEYACRASTNTPFSCGATITTDLANFDRNASYGDAPKGQYRQKTTPVGSFPPNGFGLQDMHGNVREWCEDTWHDNYTDAPLDGSSWISSNENSRLLRGGAWRNNPNNCRSASRYSWPAVIGFDHIGFRVICAQDF
jgi:eukaryotic-like serine/threonine-protein kinase